MRLYIAGPIAGYPNNNEAAFLGVEKKLIEIGHEPVNPLKEGYKMAVEAIEEPQYVDYICGGLQLLSRCDGIVLLADWQTSPGAQIEYILAKRNGIPLYKAENLPELVEVEAYLSIKWR